MSDIKQLLENNRMWSEGMKEAEPDFFDKLSKRQKPEYLWIGCSDSRVPANQLLGLVPGDIFVHRNVANLVVHTDFNCLSVLQYAIEVLKVKHVIVCGHYGCGGIDAALDDQQLGLIDNWLGHIKDIAKFHQEELATLSDEQRSARLCELNVIEQANNIRRSNIFKDAQTRGQETRIHSWIYSLRNGRIKDLAK
ncbi:carbonic anhydrase [Paraglaciecola mesophila KMM 241]|uniref:Carbonic anhydrase n=1 Tax=Paraglaciecola mesophila KMM 241 TaxID=1128912 RepID=K6ZU16_9ALTE|nr:carbonate dehydratase [Paraglaciecola mesophila]GAC26810.1 carbonic anhydrase [Paraglaciecola mesophila KMM 241]|tara:strand:+ start:20545 stop:21126 length:582 start_codon:yes stop_codon:yes gene_type:complete